MVEQGVQQSAGAEGRQFYVTHCTTADSVLNNPGYTVRAASPGDRSLLETAFHYPPYELPIEMWKERPSSEHTPRRLARTEDDHGVWIAHSAYLAKDTAGRDRSYFSHILLLSDADPAEVLRSWGSGGWVKNYPPGAAKELRTEDARLPLGDLVSDAAMTRFLGEDPPTNAELATAVCPRRLQERSARERRELFARFLHALLLLDAEEDEGRHRLYVHAEPGLLALLLYGAVRLLPRMVVGDLTFSTFEPHHRNIREYRMAQVVGTYTGNPEKGLDTDLGSARGIALDTIKPACSSPELRQPPPVGVEALVDLAVRGEWHLLPATHAAMGEAASGVAEAGQAVTRARALANVDSGRATIDEMLALQADPGAAEDLKSRGPKLWPAVRTAILDPARADVRAAFAHVVAQPEHIEELWTEAVVALRRKELDIWSSRWMVVREADLREARRHLQKLIAGTEREDKLLRQSEDVRARLRAACAEVDWTPRALLVPVGPEELEPMLAGPPATAGITAFVLLAKDEAGLLRRVPPDDRALMRRRAREFLLSAPAVTVGASIAAACESAEADSQFLNLLFMPCSTETAALLDRLLTSRGILEPEDWRKIVHSLQLLRGHWGAYLLEAERLTNLLVNLGAGAGREVWSEYLNLLTPALLWSGATDREDRDAAHRRERKIHAKLRAAAERLAGSGVKLADALPEGGVRRLFAANGLVKWIGNPASAESDGHEEVQSACTAFGIDPLMLVVSAYLAGVFVQYAPAEQPSEFAPLVSLFRTCFPVDGNFNTARRAASAAVRLSRTAPVTTRGPLQALLIQASVPAAHYQSLLNDVGRDPLDPYAVAVLSQAIQRGTKRGGPKYVPPTLAGDSPFEDEPDHGAGMVPVIHMGSRKRKARGKSRGCLLLVFAMLVAMVMSVMSMTEILAHAITQR